MEQEQIATIEPKETVWNTVTPHSKYLAMGLFVLLPFVGGYVGYTFAPEKVVEVEKVVIQKVQSEIEDSEQVISESTVIQEINFDWNGRKGKVVQECLETDKNQPLLVIAPYYAENGRVTSTNNPELPGVYCNQESNFKLIFDGMEYSLGSTIISTTTDFIKISNVGYVQTEFSFPERQDAPELDITTSSNETDRLLIGLVHQPCDWEKSVCWNFSSVTHVVDFPGFTVRELESPIGLSSGLGALKWNEERTAFVSRTALHDPVPSFSIRALDSTESINYYGDLTAIPETEEERAYAARLWDNSEVEWLNEFQVRILDETFSVE